MTDNDDDFKRQKGRTLEDKYGEHSRNFSVRNSGIECGIVRERKMTDCFMLLFFVGFLAAMGYVTNYSLKHGKVEKLMAPLDGDDHFCGQEPGYEDYQHLFIKDLSVSSVTGIFKTAVCVKACPLVNETVECKPTVEVTSCPVAFYDTKGVLNYCFPKSISNLPSSMKQGWQILFSSLIICKSNTRESLRKNKEKVSKSSQYQASFDP